MPLRVGVVFGGRSGEHEVSLASAASVIAALERGGHTVVPIGVAQDGRWVTGGDPMRALAAEARTALPSDDDTGHVKKALADRAESVPAMAETALARTEPGGGLPAGLRQALDVVVIMLHGPYGEDGTVQGLFELADLPYVGAGVLASAVGMDKATMKAVFAAHGLPIVEHVVVFRHAWRADRRAVSRRIADEIGFPCFVKPSNLGSSVGVSKVRDASELPAAMDEAARHDRKIVVERAVKAREVEVSVLGNDAPVASLPGEMRVRDGVVRLHDEVRGGPGDARHPGAAAAARDPPRAGAGDRRVQGDRLRRHGARRLLRRGRPGSPERDQHDSRIHLARAPTRGCGRPRGSTT